MPITFYTINILTLNILTIINNVHFDCENFALSLLDCEHTGFKHFDFEQFDYVHFDYEYFDFEHFDVYNCTMCNVHDDRRFQLDKFRSMTVHPKVDVYTS